MTPDALFRVASSVALAGWFRIWALVPCLLLTFLFGPAGLLLYLVVRAGARSARPQRSDLAAG